MTAMYSNPFESASYIFYNGTQITTGTSTTNYIYPYHYQYVPDNNIPVGQYILVYQWQDTSSNFYPITYQTTKAQGLGLIQTY